MLKARFSVAVVALLAMAGPSMAASMRGAAATVERFAYGHPGAGGGSPEQVIHIRALDTLRFQPSQVTVKRGTTVKFVITNTGRLAHEFVVGDAALQAAHEKEMQAMPGMSMQDVNGVTLLPGQTKDLVWTFTRDGVTEYGCHEPGHFAGGMVGRILIEPSARR